MTLIAWKEKFHVGTGGLTTVEFCTNGECPVVMPAEAGIQLFH